MSKPPGTIPGWSGRARCGIRCKESRHHGPGGWLETMEKLNGKPLKLVYFDNGDIGAEVDQEPVKALPLVFRLYFAPLPAHSVRLSGSSSSPSHIGNPTSAQCTTIPPIIRGCVFRVPSAQDFCSQRPIARCTVPPGDVNRPVCPRSRKCPPQDTLKKSTRKPLKPGRPYQTTCDIRFAGKWN